VNINVKLDTASIGRAISKLKRVQRLFDDDCSGILDALATEGADEAQRGYGGWAVQAVPFPAQRGSAEIVVYGDMPAIAEFGAGDATQYPSAYFENNSLDSEVYPGSWSIGHAMEYAILGEWRFAGHWYNEVQPHLGLYQAKVYLINNCAEIVKEAMDID
jgi:hypothetical protein